MIRKQFIIKNKSGLHARPASMFINTVSQFDSSVLIEMSDGKQINGRSIMSLLSGGLRKGTKIDVIIEGEDEDLAETALSNLFNSNFGE